VGYCTKPDILKSISDEVLIQLTDDNSVGTVDDAKVTGAIEKADSIIDGYCGKRYAVPFSPVPNLVRDMSVDLAIYNLYGNRQGAPDYWEKRRDDTIAFLKDVSKGTATIGDASAAGISGESSDNSVDISSADRVFSRDRLRGF
jgi:phage gp36-like protein